MRHTGQPVISATAGKIVFRVSSGWGIWLGEKEMERVRAAESAEVDSKRVSAAAESSNSEYWEHCIGR